MTPEEIARLRTLCEAAPFVAARTDPEEAEAFYRAAREALPQLLDEREAKAVRDAAWTVEVNRLVGERAAARDQIDAAREALPDDIRIAADGDLVRGIEGLEAAYQVERKAVEDHAREIARLRAALASRDAEVIPA